MQPLLLLSERGVRNIGVFAHVRGPETPALLVRTPFVLDTYQLAKAAGADDVPYLERVGLAAVFGSHLHDLPGGLDCIACLFGFAEDVGEGLLHVAVLAGLHHVDAQLGVLESRR